MQDIRIVYQAMNIPFEHRKEYNLFCMVKAHADGNTQKPGFINHKDEVRKLAKTNNTTTRTYQRLLDRLDAASLIYKNRYGYRLKSYNEVHQNIYNLKLKTMKKGRQTIDHARYAIPNTTDTKIIEVTRLYVLINQTHNQFQFKANGIHSEFRPESFEYGIEKMTLKGSYDFKKKDDNGVDIKLNKMTVWRLLNNLENVGLLTIERGKGRTADTNGICSKYTTYKFSKANWARMYKPKYMNRTARWEYHINDLNYIKQIKGVKIEKKAPRLPNGSEVKFLNLLKCGLQDDLVNRGHLSLEYKSFGSKQRKVTLAMIPKLLSFCLADDDLKALILSVFGDREIKVKRKEGTYYNSKLNLREYDYLAQYKYDYVTLCVTDDEPEKYVTYGGDKIIAKSVASINTHHYVIKTLKDERKKERVSTMLI